jgi:hypothetical protein
LPQRATEDGGESRSTAECLNRDRRRCRDDDSAGLQLEEVLCAGGMVLHCCLVSQAMGMCAVYGGRLAWLLPGWLGTFRTVKGSLRMTRPGCACGDDPELASHSWSGIGPSDLGNFKRARRQQGNSTISMSIHTSKCLDGVDNDSHFSSA